MKLNAKLPGVDFSRLAQALSRLFLRKYAQVIFAVVLMVLIIGVVIGNTLFVINRFRDNLDAQLQRQALVIGDLVNAIALRETGDIDRIQETLKRVYRGPDEIRSMDVLVPDGENFRIVASPVKENVGQSIEALNAVLAWHNDRAIANMTKPSTADIQADPTLSRTRYWNIIMPLHQPDGTKVGLLNLKMSLGVMDAITRQTLIGSYLLLFGTLVVVVLLLLINTSLFQYAVLFRKLQEVDEMKDEFISVASHELRTPITAIRGYTEMFTDGSFGPLTDQGKKGMAIVEASVKRLAELVEDLLNVSRIEQGRLQVENVPIDATAAIQQTIDELQVSAAEKRLALHFEAGPTPRVLADRDRLRQVLVNLIGNAIKYTRKGSVTVITRDDDKFLTIKIKDTGIGIAAHDRERLFVKFSRIQNDQTKDIVGTGLGLWITKQIVELMGGDITVDSMENVGTEVMFTLPKVGGETKK